MDKISPEVKAIANEFLKRLGENNIHIEEALLFGSQVKGGADKWSDIDIALVSDDFEGNRYKDKNKIRKITLSVNPMISLFAIQNRRFFRERSLCKAYFKNWHETVADYRQLGWTHLFGPITVWHKL